jgi:hypothetical protein
MHPGDSSRIALSRFVRVVTKSGNGNNPRCKGRQNAAFDGKQGNGTSPLAGAGQVLDTTHVFPPGDAK